MNGIVNAIEKGEIERTTRDSYRGSGEFAGKGRVIAGEMRGSGAARMAPTEGKRKRCCVVGVEKVMAADSRGQKSHRKKLKNIILKGSDKDRCLYRLIKYYVSINHYY